MESEIRMLDIKKITEITGLSRTTIWRRVRNGTFPIPRQLGPRRYAWRSDDLFDFLDGLPPVPYADVDKMNGESPPSRSG